MSLDKAELIIHPVRLRILQYLSTGPMSTQEIANQIPDVPTSSLYRHLRLLLESQFIQVSEIRLVQGIQEKIYEVSRSPHLSAKELAHATNDDHVRYFSTYLMTLLQDFRIYVSGSQSLDMEADKAGYSESVFWASPDELATFQSTIQATLSNLTNNKREAGRQRYKLAVVFHPVSRGEILYE